MAEALPLFDLPPASEPAAPPPTSPGVARVFRAVRNQVEWMPRDLDRLLADYHPARSIWAFLEELELSAFYADIKAVLERPGHPATDPQVLLALWVYATVDGVGSARKLARLCAEHDVYRWLRGGVPVNYHMLSDFRVAHQGAMDELLTGIVAAMMVEGLVTLREVAQDGLKVRASAGAASFRWKATLEQCLEAAQERVKRLAQEREHPDPGVSQRERAARGRAARERQERVEEALRQFPHPSPLPAAGEGMLWRRPRSGRPSGRARRGRKRSPSHGSPPPTPTPE